MATIYTHGTKRISEPTAIRLRDAKRLRMDRAKRIADRRLAAFTRRADRA